MSTGAIVGTFRWIPAEDNGPTVPFERERIAAFAYVGSQLHDEAAILVRGLAPGHGEQVVEAHWVEGDAAPVAKPGDVITLVASQRPIATLAVTSV